MSEAAAQLAATRELLRVPEAEAFLGGFWNEQAPACHCSERGHGTAWLFRGRLGLIFPQSASAVDLPISRLRRLHRTDRRRFHRGTFSLPPQRIFVVQLHMEGGSTTTLEFTDAERGEQVGRTLDFLWRWRQRRLAVREVMFLACNQLPDVVAVVALLPFQARCGLAVLRAGKTQREERGTGVLHVAVSLEKAVITWQRCLDGEADSNPVELNLDGVIQVQRVKSTVRVRVGRRDQTGDEYILSNFADVGSAEDQLMRIWALNCNSIVTWDIQKSQIQPHWHRASVCSDSPTQASSVPGRSKVTVLDDVVCFSLSEVARLLRTFQAIDRSGTGYIGPDEFCASLGPAFSGSSRQVPLALFRVFDVKRDGKICFSEFLFGSRVLRLGSRADRIKYQCRLFDVQGTGRISLSGLEQMAAVLAEVGAFRVPEGQTVPEVCAALFAQLGVDARDTCPVEKLSECLQQGDSAFVDAFGQLTAMRSSLEETTLVRGGEQIMFGDPAWLTGTCILSGIQHAVNHRVAACVEPGVLSHAAFHDKVTWNITTGEQVAGNVHKSAPPKGQQASPANCEVFFTDYCPLVFHDVQRNFDITPEQYLAALGIDNMVSSMLLGAMTSLCSLSSSGRSGAFFFGSHDGQFILKTIPAAEAATLQRILPAYHAHCRKHTGTLLTRYYGLHSLRYASIKLNFVVMGNVIRPPPGLTCTELYDLKGSTVGRTVPPERRGDRVALKDLDMRRVVELDAETHARLLRELESDSAMLCEANLNDYSCLIGIHTASDPIPPPPGLGVWDPLRNFHGGMPSYDGCEVIFAGIIDILTYFGPLKKTEHAVKSLQYAIAGGRPGDVSCVPPPRYQERFMRFLRTKLVVGHGDRGSHRRTQPLCTPQRPPKVSTPDSVPSTAPWEPLGTLEHADPEGSRAPPETPRGDPLVQRKSTGPLAKTMPQPGRRSAAKKRAAKGDDAGPQREQTRMSGQASEGGKSPSRSPRRGALTLLDGVMDGVMDGAIALSRQRGMGSPGERRRGRRGAGMDALLSAAADLSPRDLPIDMAAMRKASRRFEERVDTGDRRPTARA